MNNPVTEKFADLYKRLTDAGFKTLPQLFKKLVLKRTPEEHAKWDDETGKKAYGRIVEGLAHGIHGASPDEPEVPVSDLKLLDERPPLDGGILPDSPDTPENLALKEAGAFELDGRRILVRNLQNVTTSIKSLLTDKKVWIAHEVQTKSTGLYLNVIEPVQNSLAEVFTYDTALDLACRISQIYGVRIRKVTAEQIYQETPRFLLNARSGTTVTNSRSTGIIDPLEKFGTVELLRLLGIDRDHPVADEIDKKDAWRLVNIDKGYLNDKLGADKRYFFDYRKTSRAMKRTANLLPERLRDKYVALATKNLIEALSCKRFELYEVPGFLSWMDNYTRSGNGNVLISFRHDLTKSITHGLDLTFRKPEDWHVFFGSIFQTGALSGPFAGFPLALSFALAGIVEGVIWHGISKKLLRLNADKEVFEYSKRIAFEGETKKQKHAFARTYIESLLK